MSVENKNMGTEHQDSSFRIGDILNRLLSSNLQERKGGIEEAIQWLKSGTLDPLQISALCNTLVQLAKDPHWEIRYLIVSFLNVVPSPYFDQIVALLLSDPNHFVREGAQKTLKQRQKLNRQISEKTDINDLIAIDQTITSKYPKEIVDRIKKSTILLFRSYANQTHHDLLKLLTPLKSSLERLQKKYPDSDFQKTLSYCELIQKMIQDIQKWSEKITPVLRKKDLYKTVEEVVEMAKESCRETVVINDINVEIRIVKNQYVNLPESYFTSALLNLLCNAFESFRSSTKSVKQIVVSAQVDPDKKQLRCVIEDTGCGIRQTDKEAIFLPGQTNKEGHTGYGLANAKKHIEEACDGTLQLESQQGQGTKVTLQFPVKEEEEEYDPST